ncbi:MAG TPA: hypothetical protein VF981_13945 [Gemmatimonadaceae bacterium]
MSLLSSCWTLLLVQDTGIRDTVVMIQAPVDRSAMETLVAGGQFAVSLVVLILLAAIVIVLVALRKSVQELTRLLHSSYGDISAAAHAVRNVSEDVRGITQSVKTDVAAVSDTVRYVNKGVRRAVRRARWRLDRLDALVDVAQEEAEDLVMSTASAVRGVQAGAAALRRTFQFNRRHGLKRKRKRRSWRDDRPDSARERPRIRVRVVEET